MVNLLGRTSYGETSPSKTLKMMKKKHFDLWVQEMEVGVKGSVNWKFVKGVMSENKELVRRYKKMLKSSYGSFVGDDWMISLSYLITELKNPGEVEDVVIKRQIKELNKRIKRRITQISNSSNYRLRKYTVRELRKRDTTSIIRLINVRYLTLKHNKETLMELRYEIKLLSKELRRLLIENYQLRKCKNKKGMMKKITIKGIAKTGR